MQAECDAPRAGAAPALRDAQGESDDDALTLGEQGSLAHGLNDKYGIPWSLSALELEKLRQTEVSVDPTVTDPTQVFMLTSRYRLPDNMHPLS